MSGDELYKALEKFNKNGTDNEAISFMKDHWPHNIMLHNKKDVTELERMMQTSATSINDKIYTVQTMTVDRLIHLIRKMTVLSNLIYLYMTQSNLLGDCDVDLVGVKNALIWTADAMQNHIVRTHAGASVSSSSSRLSSLLSQF